MARNHPAIGELVKARLYYQRIAEMLDRQNYNGKSIIIYIKDGEQSKLTGHGGKLLKKLKEEYGIANIKVKTAETQLYQPKIKIEEEKQCGLKSLEMQGFKSFPDKTKITIDSGVTAIIGPNGSGKSNISDAIRWVLGEMSLKSLRGNKMEDVIFNGTAGRQPSNYCSVSICFDTEEEFIANLDFDTPEEDDGKKKAADAKISLSDNKETTITRKYYRTGESEYYINKTQVRLKDIYELLYDTGIGREAIRLSGRERLPRSCHRRATSGAASLRKLQAFRSSAIKRLKRSANSRKPSRT
jgi:energy-coupling factor transporter ATP-binding protein EcfA2